MEPMKNILLGVSYAAILDTELYESRENDDQSRLVVVAGRTERIVGQLLDACVGKVDAEFRALLDKSFVDKSGTNGADDKWRVFAVLKRATSAAAGDGTDGGTGFAQLVRHVCPQIGQNKTSIWFMFPGQQTVADAMPSLMAIPAFRASVEASGRVLAAQRVDLTDCLAERSDWRLCQDIRAIRRLAIGSAVCQIALADTLSTAGVRPGGGCLGTCIGEMMCMWALGMCSPGQLFRLRSAVPAEIIANRCPYWVFVARVPADELRRWCPDLHINGHYGRDYCLVSGTERDTARRHRELTEAGFAVGNVARKVNQGHWGHRLAAPGTYEALRRAFAETMPGRVRVPPAVAGLWLRASIQTPSARADTGDDFGDQLSVAEHLANAMVAPVMFTEAVDRLPGDALVINIDINGALRDIALAGRAQAAYVTESTASCHVSGVNHLLRELGLAFTAGHWPRLIDLMADRRPE